MAIFSACQVNNDRSAHRRRSARAILPRACGTSEACNEQCRCQIMRWKGEPMPGKGVLVREGGDGSGLAATGYV